MDKLYTEVFQAMVAMPFEDPARWNAVVEQLKAAGQWSEGAPLDFDGHKKFIEENKYKLSRIRISHWKWSWERSKDCIRTSMHVNGGFRRPRMISGGFVNAFVALRDDTSLRLTLNMRADV